MAHILILSASTGEGHNQAAATLATALEARGHTTSRADIFANANKVVEKIMNRGYFLIVRIAPFLYGIGYRLFDSPLFPWLVGRVSHAQTGLKLLALINRERPSVIVSTHPFVPAILGHHRASGRLTVPMIQIVTDFAAHYIYIDTAIDAFVVAGEETRRGMVRRGIDPTRIHLFGIPVRSDFSRVRDVPLPPPGPGRTRLLIMGGSMGLAPMETAVHALAASKGGFHMTVVCGANKGLKRRLDRSLAQEVAAGTVEIRGYSRDIPDLMARSHLVVTKPGGLTSSEAIISARPMVITFAIPGQEAQNRDYLVAQGLGLAMDKPAGIARAIEELLADPERYRAMGRSMAQFAAQHSLDRVADLVEGLIEA